MGVVRDMLRFSPLDVGEEVPPLSLTADEGTWVKIRDFRGNLNVVLVFFRDESADTEAYLKALDAAKGQFEALDAVVYGINTAPPIGCGTCAPTCAWTCTSSTTPSP